LFALWIIISAGSLLLGLFFLRCSKPILESPALLRLNYRGAEVPTSAGLIFTPVFLVVWIVVLILHRSSGYFRSAGQDMSALMAGLYILLILVLGMSLVGFLDDVAGDRSVRGFAGHFTEALHGRFTTGFFKALIGFLVALVVTSGLFRILHPLWKYYGKWFLSAAIVALAANLFNLLDLRPGRALKLYFPLMLLTAGLALRFGYLRYGYILPAVPVIAAALVLFPGDLKEKHMLGDAGSNVLGAVVGLGLVMEVNVWWQIGILVFLVFLTVLSEKFSFSRAIEGNRVLNWLDELGRRRIESPEGKE
jgi:UDP-GlcNAc:undecaprenyl-phosphate/decaprenyl-phosphate GlcNAc-1-phosphate transferase